MVFCFLLLYIFIYTLLFLLVSFWRRTMEFIGELRGIHSISFSASNLTRSINIIMAGALFNFNNVNCYDLQYIENILGYI